MRLLRLSYFETSLYNKSIFLIDHFKIVSNHFKTIDVKIIVDQFKIVSNHVKAILSDQFKTESVH